MVILAVVWSNLIKPFVIKLCKISNKELFLNTVLCDNFGRSMIKSNQNYNLMQRMIPYSLINRYIERFIQRAI